MHPAGGDERGAPAFRPTECFSIEGVELVDELLAAFVQEVAGRRRQVRMATEPHIGVVVGPTGRGREGAVWTCVHGRPRPGDEGEGSLRHDAEPSSL